MPLSALKGRQLMLCDVIYQRGSKKTDWKDYINIIYRDMVTGKKDIYTIEEPEIDIFIVKEEYRKRGLARDMLVACQKWAKEQGCTEFASDCELDNEDSLKFHLKMGFEEANRIICFTKKEIRE